MKIEIESIGDGKRWTFEQREVVLGRDPQCDVRLSDEGHPMVSRRHAVVVTTPEGELWLEDQNSFNGTLLNSQRITRERLDPGDIFRLGGDGPGFRVNLPGVSAVYGAETKPLGMNVSPAHTQAGHGMRAMPASPGFGTTAQRPAPAGFATTAQRPAPPVAAPTPLPTPAPRATGAGIAAPTGYSAPPTEPDSSYDELTLEEQAMLERKIAVMRNLVVIVILLCLGLVGVVVYQGQEIRKTHDTLRAMQRQADSAVGQFMPSLNSRLNRFDSRLDEFEVKMNSLDNQMRRAEDRFVQRMDVEMPKIMDRYLQMKANELQRGGKAEVRVR